jgi:hypothetical protein
VKVPEASAIITLIKNAPGNGIIVLGLGDNLVYNNYIINSGAYGIFADSRYTPPGLILGLLIIPSYNLPGMG